MRTEDLTQIQASCLDGWAASDGVEQFPSWSWAESEYECQTLCEEERAEVFKTEREVDKSVDWTAEQGHLYAWVAGIYS
jgi:hypothetical protein